MDIIQRLRELRQSSESSVVVGNDNHSLHERAPYRHALEAWLVNFILDQVTDPAGLSYTLVVLAGNAGDGKSYLLREIRRTLVQHHLSPHLVHWLLDATESDSPAEGSEQRLTSFFSPLADDADWSAAPLHVVAMNTGTAARFIEHCEAHAIYGVLRDILALQLAIRHAPERPADTFWERYERVLVIDLDRRMLIPLTAAASPPDPTSFIHHLCEAISPANPQGTLAGAKLQCRDCPHCNVCPVHANVQLLRQPVVRQRLSALLLDIALEERIHIGPRSLWHLAYLMTVGGLDAARLETARPLLTCADMGNVDSSTRARGLFFSALFDAGVASTSTAPAALLAELRRVDPAARFTLAGHEIALTAGISAEEDSIQAHNVANRHGINPAAVCGPSGDENMRATLAVRRAFFLRDEDPDPVRHEWLRQWADFLERWREDILSGRDTRPESGQVLVDVLKQLFTSAGRADFVRLDLPWRGKQELYAYSTIAADRRSKAVDARVTGPDHERPGGTRPELVNLSRCIDAYPLAVVASLRDGPKVRITWPLFRLLQRVKDQHYLALSLSPERVQHLERVGASLGAAAAFTRGVAVRDHDRMQLCIEENEEIDVVDC